MDIIIGGCVDKRSREHPIDGDNLYIWNIKIKMIAILALASISWVCGER